VETLSNLVISWIAFAGRHAAVLFGISIATLIMTFILLPIMITRLPQNYFCEDDRPRPLSRFLVVHWALMALKNLLGFAFVLLGIMLLFLPGQGVLTLVIGLTIMNYPGKFAIERWLAMRPHVLPALNWLRRRYGRPPLDDP
jgi:hypothetical protein